MKPRKTPGRLLVEGNNGANATVPVRLEYKEDAGGWRGTIQTPEPVLTEDATHLVRLGDYRMGTIRIHDVDRSGKSARFTGVGAPERMTKASATG